MTREFINIRCRKQRQNSKIPVNTFVYEIVRIDTPCFSRRYNIKTYIYLSSFRYIEEVLKPLTEKAFQPLEKVLLPLMEKVFQTLIEKVL